MKYLPVIIGVLIYAIAYGVYSILPSAYDGEHSLFWIVAAFFVVYIIAAVYVSLSVSPF